MSNLFTEHAEAACCIWEALLERRTRDDAEPDAIVDCFEQRGAGEMRHAAIALSLLCCDVWDELTPEERPDLFDWEFVPHFVYMLTDAQHPRCVEIPSTEDAVALYRESNPASRRRYVTGRHSCGMDVG
jgi:hypothetical protein